MHCQMPPRTVRMVMPVITDANHCGNIPMEVTYTSEFCAVPSIAAA